MTRKNLIRSLVLGTLAVAVSACVYGPPYGYYGYYAYPPYPEYYGYPGSYYDGYYYPPSVSFGFYGQTWHGRGRH